MLVIGSLQLLQLLRDLLAVTQRVDFFEYVRDPAGRIDEERGARDPHALEAKGVLLDPHAERRGQCVVFVGQETEGKLVFLLELAVRVRRVGAGAKYFRVESLEPREGVSQGARLDGSARGIVLRIPIEDNPFPVKRGERHGTTGVVDGLEVWRLVSNRNPGDYTRHFRSSCRRDLDSEV